MGGDRDAYVQGHQRAAAAAGAGKTKIFPRRPQGQPKDFSEAAFWWLMSKSTSK